MFAGTARAQTLERFDALDFEGVSRIVVEGPGSEVDIVATRNGARSASVEASGWSARFCGARASLERDGEDLLIRVERNTIGLPFGCDLLLRLAVPEGLAVSVRQAATVARFSGSFGALRVESPKAVVALSGGAPSISIESNEAKVDLAFAVGAPHAEISSDKLVANIGLPSSAAVGWQVDAPVSMFSSDFPNTAGAAARIEIRSRYLKGSLYRIRGAS